MTIWDVFAGSGAFGVECISRYANSNVVFTDVAPESVAAVRKNVAAVSADAQSKIIQTDAIAAIGRFGADADLVFVDCPYDSAEIGRAFVNKLGRAAKTGTILVWEQEAENAVEPNTEIWETLRDKTYGRARFLILSKK